MFTTLSYAALVIVPVVIAVYIANHLSTMKYNAMFDILCDHAAAIRCLQGNCDTVEETEDIEHFNPSRPGGDRLPLQGHGIVVGWSGSGKSNTIMSLLMRKLNDGQQIYIIDTKNELAPIFGNHRSVTTSGLEGASDVFKELIDLSAERQQLFADTSTQYRKLCRDYGEYYKLTGHKLPVITLFVEELIATMQEVEQKDLIKLLVMGRSAGVFVFCAAQYLKSDILDRKGSINFNTRIFMGRYDRYSVSTLFGDISKEEVESIKEFVGTPGKAVIEENGALTFQTMPRVSEKELERFL